MVISLHSLNSYQVYVKISYDNLSSNTFLLMYQLTIQLGSLQLES